jgi:hypothetical protein
MPYIEYYKDDNLEESEDNPSVLEIVKKKYHSAKKVDETTYSIDGYNMVLSNAEANK